MIRKVIHSTSTALLIIVVFSLILFNQAKPFIDTYANHASVLGLLVSIVGFALTVWTVLEAIKANERAQAEIQKQVNAVRHEMRDLLSKIRTKSLDDTREQTNLLAREAKSCIRQRDWGMAVVQCREARRFAQRLLAFQDLEDTDRTSLRRIVEDLTSIATFIEKNRSGPKADLEMPPDKSKPLEALIDVLESIQSRSHQLLLEALGDDI